MRDPVTFEFGGKARSVVVKIGLAVQIENALGMGVLNLADKLRTLSATTTESVTVVRLALESIGQIYSQERALELAFEDGLVETQISALKLCNSLFIKPKDDAKPKKGKAKEPDPLDATP